jgi:PPOX class probable F420-dependent enzyme
MKDVTPEARQKLETAHNIWLATVRPDGRPHLAPVWFAWCAGKLYICTEPASVKARNIQANARVVLALEDGDSPVICEGTAAPISAPWPREVIDVYRLKYDWDISSDSQYAELIEVTPDKWLAW